MKTMKNDWIITSYYTRDTYYEGVARDHIMKSVKELELPHIIKEVANLGDWQKNTHYKATFVSEMLRTGKDVVFVDCDAKIHSYPILFDTIDTDVAYHHYCPSGRPNRNELLSGTMFFKNNEKVAELVAEWQKALLNSTIWEQKILAQIVDDYKKRGKISVTNLPPQYCTIFDFMGHVKDPVVEHFQKSRLYRRNKSLKKELYP